MVEEDRGMCVSGWESNEDDPEGIISELDSPLSEWLDDYTFVKNVGHWKCFESA